MRSLLGASRSLACSIGPSSASSAGAGAGAGELGPGAGLGDGRGGGSSVVTDRARFPACSQVGWFPRSYNEPMPNQPPPRSAAEDIESSTLRAELDAYRNGVVDRWLDATLAEGRIVREYENSLSWRVTRPLRLARRGFSAVRTVGPVAVVRIVLERRRSRRS